MKVFVKGKGEVTLTSANFVAEGGQASVYQKNGTAYKIYTKPEDAIPEAKFLELWPIADPNVIRPEALLLNAIGSNEVVGYTMRFIKDTLALCQLFPRVFRERRGVSPWAMADLVGKLRARIEHVHRAGAVIVDLNELNVLVPDSLADVFLIDVDSYQTKSFRAEVIMPSVRDYSVKPSTFSPLSDWYSFAILAFQMYVGIHPYKGSHPKTAGLPPGERLEARMRQNLSAFGSEVSLPKACYPLDAIPAAERAWMRAVLEEGKRVPPPSVEHVQISIMVSAPAPKFGEALFVAELFVFEDSIAAYAMSGGRELVLTTNGTLYLDRRPIARGLGVGVTAVAIGFTPKLAEPVVLTLFREELSLWDRQTGLRQKIGADVSELVKSGDLFHVRVGERVLEVDFWEKGAGPTASATHVVANVLESAARLFEGCAVQSMLGSAFVSLFPGSHAGYQVRMPELDKYRVVDAKYERGVLMVVGAKAGEYDRLVFRFDESFASYDTEVVPSITPAGLSFVVTPSGLIVHVTEDEKLVVCSAKKGVSMRRVVEDPAIGGMRLLPVGGRVGFARDKSLYTMTLK